MTWNCRRITPICTGPSASISCPGPSWWPITPTCTQSISPTTAAGRTPRYPTCSDRRWGTSPTCISRWTSTSPLWGSSPGSRPFSRAWRAGRSVRCPRGSNSRPSRSIPPLWLTHQTGPAVLCMCRTFPHSLPICWTTSAASTGWTPAPCPWEAAHWPWGGRKPPPRNICPSPPSWEEV